MGLERGLRREWQDLHKRPWKGIILRRWLARMGQARTVTPISHRLAPRSLTHTTRYVQHLDLEAQVVKTDDLQDAETNTDAYRTCGDGTEHCTIWDRIFHCMDLGLTRIDWL